MWMSVNRFSMQKKGIAKCYSCDCVNGIRTKWINWKEKKIENKNRWRSEQRRLLNCLTLCCRARVFLSVCTCVCVCEIHDNDFKSLNMSLLKFHFYTYMIRYHFSYSQYLYSFWKRCNSHQPSATSNNNIWWSYQPIHRQKEKLKWFLFTLCAHHIHNNRVRLRAVRHEWRTTTKKAQSNEISFKERRHTKWSVRHFFEIIVEQNKTKQMKKKIVFIQNDSRFRRLMYHHTFKPKTSLFFIRPCFFMPS